MAFQKERTVLYHGLPAVLDKDDWIIIANNFDNIATIPKSKLDDNEMYEKLKLAGFFQTYSREHTTESNVTLVTLITTSDCNLRCKYCFANSGEKSIVMSETIAKASIEYAISISKDRILSIAFFGGEPTLTQNLIKKTVEFARKQVINKDILGLEFSITTNGIISKDFLKFLILNKFQITLSVDGPPNIQNFHRPTKTGGESYLLVEKTIKELVDNKVNFKVRVTVTDYSVGQMSNTVKWAHELGINQIHFEAISISGRASLSAKGTGLTKPKVITFIKNLKEAINTGEILGVGVINSSLMNIQNSPDHFCDGNSLYRFAVTFNGDVTTCVEVQEKCHPVFNQFTIGKFNPEKNILEITKSSRGHACLPNIDVKTNKECTTCFARRVCGGGCPIRNYHVNGDSAIVDPYRCKTIKEMLYFTYKKLYKYSVES